QFRNNKKRETHAIATIPRQRDHLGTIPKIKVVQDKHYRDRKIESITTSLQAKNPPLGGFLMRLKR
ncbi:hypothetical protein, partial [Pseudomonas sp.]|uniref:hypothetical protein n=1 Tax=Pseudomonas sp. TaxID=306 RepID=UPI00271E4A60